MTFHYFCGQLVTPKWMNPVHQHILSTTNKKHTFMSSLSEVGPREVTQNRKPVVSGKSLPRVSCRIPRHLLSASIWGLAAQALQVDGFGRRHSSGHLSLLTARWPYKRPTDPYGPLRPSALLSASAAGRPAPPARTLPPQSFRSRLTHADSPVRAVHRPLWEKRTREKHGHYFGGKKEASFFYLAW